MESLKNILRTTYAHTLGDQINFFKGHYKGILALGLVNMCLMHHSGLSPISQQHLNQTQEQIQHYDPNSENNNLENSLNNK